MDDPFCNSSGKLTACIIGVMIGIATLIYFISKK